MKLSQKKTIEYEVLYKSLIGNEIEIIDSNNSKLIGTKGTLVHETAKYLILQYKSSTLRIFKSNVTIKITILGKPLKMDGRLLLSTLTNRIKKLK